MGAYGYLPPLYIATAHPASASESLELAIACAITIITHALDRLGKVGKRCMHVYNAKN